MDVKKFIHLWWSDFSSSLPPNCEEWIEESYRDTTSFWVDLFNLHKGSHRVPIQSELGRQYDFYHDCILRHLSANEVALTTIDQQQQSKNWTYKQLHRCVNFNLGKWLKTDIQAGQTIAILLPTGIEYTIALLCALRLGLRLLILPPDLHFLGPVQIENWIKELQPNYIVAQDGISLNVKEPSPLSIDVKGEDDEDQLPPSYPYEAAAKIQLTLTLFRQSPFIFVPIDAESLYLHSIREGLLTLNLRENGTWASPLSCEIAMEPAATLSTFLAGARRILVSNEDLRRNPQLLKDEKIQLLAISSSLQQLWTETPAMPTRSLKACFRTSWSLNPRAWKTFVQQNKLEKIPSFHSFFDNSRGGCEIFTRPILDEYDLFFRPSLGSSWSLNNIDALEVPSTNGMGIFTIRTGNKQNNEHYGNIQLSYVDQRFYFFGVHKPSKEGMTFPLEAIEKLVAELPFVETAMVYPVLRFTSPLDRLFLLLVFVNPMKKTIEEDEKKQWTNEIEQHLQKYLGKNFLPDRIEYYPLYPKMGASGIDRYWCMNHYDKGLFAKKMGTTLYPILHQLKKLSLGPKD